MTFNGRPRNMPVGTVIRNGRRVGRERNLNPGARLRNCVWTLNNPTQQELEFLKAWETNKPERIRFACGQLEQGADGTKHVQGYSEFLNYQPNMAGIKRLHGTDRMHIERRHGSQQQAIDYTKKEETRVTGDDAWSFECGARRRQGQAANDNLDTVVKMMDEGEKLVDILESCPKQAILHGAKITNEYLNRQPDRHLEPSNENIIIIYGKSGTGKSVTAYEEFPGAYDLRLEPGHQLFWQGYTGEDTILINEFGRGGGLKYKEIKTLFDIHPMKLNVKHGGTKNVSKKVVITTTIHPKQWYPWIKDKEELQRRIREFSTMWHMRSQYGVGHEKEGESVQYPEFRKIEKSMTNFEFDPYDPEWKNAEQDQH